MDVKIIEGCIGCGLCVRACADVFQMTGEGLAEVYAQPAPGQGEAVHQAAEGCPVEVIVVNG